MSLDSSPDGGKPIFYIFAVTTFAIAIVIIGVLLFSSKQEKVVVAEEFKDARDFYGFSSCPLPDWESLDKTWMESCVTLPQSDSMRAYRFTFKVDDEEKIITTNNWKEIVTEKRIARPVMVSVKKNGKQVLAQLFWEAQHASFII